MINNENNTAYNTDDRDTLAMVKALQANGLDVVVSDGASRPAQYLVARKGEVFFKASRETTGYLIRHPKDLFLISHEN